MVENYSEKSHFENFEFSRQKLNWQKIIIGVKIQTFVRIFLARKFKWDIFWWFSNTVFLWEKMGKLIPIFFLLNFLLGKTWFSNFLAHEILFGFQISYGGFDIFSGRTLLNWQARFFDHFFIPRAHEFSNGIRSVGKVRIKGVWKKKSPDGPQFQAQDRNSNLYHVFP